MAFTDPQKVKIGASEINLPRVKTEGKASEYSNEDSTVDLTLSTIETKNSRLRHTVRLDKSKITTNPYDTTQNINVGMSAYLVIDRPEAGFTVTEAEELSKALTEFCTSANVKKVLGRES